MCLVPCCGPERWLSGRRGCGVIERRGCTSAHSAGGLSGPPRQQYRPVRRQRRHGGVLRYAIPAACPVKETEIEEIIIKPGGGPNRFWRDLWRFRGLFYFLVWRDILVRYKQMAIGVAWAVVRPLLTMVVFTVIFGKIAGLPSDGAPYPILVLCALLPWQFFANSLSESSTSLISNAGLLSKVYFPRLIIPVSSVLVNLIDFMVSFLLLCLLMAWYGFAPGTRILALPAFLLLTLVASLGAGLWFSALNVRYRDFRFIVPFLVQFGLFVSPVGFSSAVVPEKWRMLYSLNPMVGAIDGFRWAILGGTSPLYLPGAFPSLVVTALMFCGGVWYFRRAERFFADVI